MTRQQRRNERKRICHNLRAEYRPSWFSRTGAPMPEEVRKAWPREWARLLP